MKKQLSLVAAGLAVLGLVSCGSSDDESVSDAKQAFCQSLTAVAQDAEAVKSLNAESTVDDAQTAVDNLKGALSAAKSAAKQVGESEQQALQEAYDGLQSSIQGISGSDTLGEAAPTVTKARDTFIAQWDAIRSKNCGQVSPSTT